MWIWWLIECLCIVRTILMINPGATSWMKPCRAHSIAQRAHPGLIHQLEAELCDRDRERHRCSRL